MMNSRKKLAVSIGIGGVLALGLASALLTTGLVTFGGDDPVDVEASLQQAVLMSDAAAQAAAQPAVTPEPGATLAPLPTVQMIPDTISGDERDNSISWIRTQELTLECMEREGFPGYRYAASWQVDRTGADTWTDDLSEADRQKAEIAKYGDSDSGADYHWKDAGCWGEAVHKMGNDNNS